ncbi:MAG: hypothetical protein C4308_05170 [Chitinophagaceae bacterium]
MKKTIFIFLFGCFLSASAQAQDTQALQMEIMMKIFGLKNALINKDSVALADLLAEDVSYGHTNGLIQTRSQLIRSVMSAEQDYKSIDVLDMKVRLYDNTAVVTMKSKIDMIYQGKPLMMDMNITLVWVRIKGQWKLVARQSVKL